VLTIGETASSLWYSSNCRFTEEREVRKGKLTI
jgi:hypothetical protein